MQAAPQADPVAVARLVAVRNQLDPFALAPAIDRKIERLVALATPARKPNTLAVSSTATTPAAEPVRRPPGRPAHVKDFTFGNHLRRPLPQPTRVTS